ncbi:MAG: hypothetical protein JSR58_04515 [Verrucomicrobia bacterium]|nr:hypothetical protein [Verrucomicrobiota bacterium]
MSTNEDKTVDLRLTSSSGGLLEPLPANTASLTLTKNPHVQFLPLLPEAITSITVTDCAVRMLPPLNNLTCLKSLVIGNSQVKQVCLSDLPQLEKVAIYKGQLTAFTVKGCPSVKKVNLEDNQLKEVPTTLAELSALEELKLGGNLITQRPAWLSKIKNAFLDKSYAAPKSNFWNKLKQITHW